MKNAFVLFVLAVVCGAAQAQIKCWNDANGKRVCGDTPPPGAQTTTIRGTSSAPSGASQSGTAKKGPLTPAEQEQEFQKRRIEAAKDAEKAAAAQKEAAAKKENCEQAQGNVRNLESGQRQVRIDSNGERVFLDDSQVAEELARAKQVQSQWCN